MIHKNSSLTKFVCYTIKSVKGVEVVIGGKINMEGRSVSATAIIV